jgi:hypothetical protein
LQNDDRESFQFRLQKITGLKSLSIGRLAAQHSRTPQTLGLKNQFCSCIIPQVLGLSIFAAPSAVMVSPFKSKARLEAENATLRLQFRAASVERWGVGFLVGLVADFVCVLAIFGANMIALFWSTRAVVPA